MFERYTERARRAIFYSRYEALWRDSAAIESSDLALGLTREKRQPDGPSSFLHERGEEIRTLLGGAASPTDKPPDKDIPLTAMAKRALTYGMEEADRDGSYAIESEHLFRGVLRTNDATAKKLKSNGWTLKWARERSKDLQPGPAKTNGASGWRLRRRLRRGLIAAAIVAFVAAMLYMHFQRWD